MTTPKVISRNATSSELDSDYKWGFEIDIESDLSPKGLNEDIVRLISAKKEEPEWLLEWRLKAFSHWLKLKQQAPTWANVSYPPIDYQDIYYYAAPKTDAPKSMDEVDPEILEAFTKLGIPLQEQERLAGVAVDAVLDSASVATTYKATLEKQGIIFCPISEAVKEHPELVQKYLGSVVPYGDNFYATLNSAVFSDGSFVYIPKDVRCPIELMTYFRINQADSGQFERTLIIAEEGSYVSYLEGCTAPARKTHQLHAAVVELVALDNSEIKYSTLQNWFPGDKDGNGGVYNFVTKRGTARKNAKISWTQVETGSAITWKYPSVIRRRQLGWRVLFGSPGQQSSAGGHRHQDDSQRQEHPQHHCCQGYLCWAGQCYLSWSGQDTALRRWCEELYPVRLSVGRRQVRRPYRSLHRSEEPHRPARA